MRPVTGRDPSSSYSYSMVRLVTLTGWPPSDRILPAAGSDCPSTCSAVIRHAPCNRSRSVIFLLIFDGAPRHAHRLASFEHPLQDPVALRIVLPFVPGIRQELTFGAVAH